MQVCCLCERELGTTLVQEHHLIPKTFKGKLTVPLHAICHQKIHATFSERELHHYYHTPDRLRQHSEIQRFIKWVSKKPIDYYDKNDDTKDRHRKR